MIVSQFLSNDGQILMTELIWHVAGKKIGSTELAQTLLNADIFQAMEDDEEENSSSSSSSGNRNNNLASWFLDTIWNVYNEIDSTRTTILNLVEQNEELDPGMELDDAEEQAENLGIEIYPGFSASEILFGNIISNLTYKSPNVEGKLWIGIPSPVYFFT